MFAERIISHHPSDNSRDCFKDSLRTSASVETSPNVQIVATEVLSREPEPVCFFCP